jgi:hypothetical protein
MIRNSKSKHTINITHSTPNTAQHYLKYAFLPFLLAATFCITFFCAFAIDKNSTLKDITHPYINRYECTSATLGDVDLLENFEYFRIDILNDSELEVSFKKKDDNAHSYKSTYTYDNKSGELVAEIGILGCKFKQAVVIQNGKFTITMPILYKTLVMNFAVK